MSYFRSAVRRTKTQKYDIHHFIVLSLRGATDENMKIRQSQHLVVLSLRGAKRRKYVLLYFRVFAGAPRSLNTTWLKSDIIDNNITWSGCVNKAKNDNRLSLRELTYLIQNIFQYDRKHFNSKDESTKNTSINNLILVL
jgi:hypothetical protein